MSVTSCRKIRHQSREAAQRHKLSLVRRDNVPRAALDVYWHEACGAFHVGHRPIWQRLWLSRKTGAAS
jgi:hypothetical protein